MPADDGVVGPPGRQLRAGRPRAPAVLTLVATLAVPRDTVATPPTSSCSRSTTAVSPSSTVPPTWSRPATSRGPVPCSCTSSHATRRLLSSRSASWRRAACCRVTSVTARIIAAQSSVPSTAARVELGGELEVTERTHGRDPVKPTEHPRQRLTRGNRDGRQAPDRATVEAPPAPVDAPAGEVKLPCGAARTGAWRCGVLGLRHLAACRLQAGLARDGSVLPVRRSLARARRTFRSAGLQRSSGRDAEGGDMLRRLL